LARDLNSNGKIDDASELFGNATETGFTALSKLDSNKDGKIDSSDTAFGTLRVWQDLDQDGVTDAGELRTLTEAGIASISLSTTTPNLSVVNGNTIHAESVVTKTNGTTTKISDVELVTSETDTRYLGDTTVSGTAAALPALRGYGEIKDLRVAMSQDATLRGQMQSFVALSPSTAHASLKSSVETMLYRWAGVDGVAATALGSGFDLRKLAFIEKYFGYQLAPRDGNGQPTSTNVGELINLWNAALDKAFLRLAIQGPLAAQFPHVTFDPSSGDFKATSAATLAEAYAGVLALLPSDHTAALTAWNTDWAPMLANFAEALTRSDQNTVKVDYAIANLVRALDGTNIPLSLTELVGGLGYSGVQIGTAAGEQMSRNAGGMQVYVAGGGNDTITGGAGQDVYVFGRNFGQDTVIDAEGGNRQSGDRLRFALLNSSDVTMFRDGLDLVVQVKNSTDKVTVRNQFATADVQSGWVLGANYGVEDIQFADGVILEAQEIAEAVGQGSAGDDHMLGSIRNDWLQGNKGNDLLEGGDGGDSYYFVKGDGKDTIRDVMDNTTIRTADSLFLMGGLSSSDVKIDRVGAGLHNGDNLLIAIGDSGDQVLIEGQFFYTPLGFSGPFALEDRIENVFFEIGQGWNWLGIQQKLIRQYTTDGNDTLYGFGTDDEFASSKGDDFISGGDGGDTYHFDLGSGKDTIYDGTQYITLSMNDSLVFGKGISLADLVLTRDGASGDLTIGFKGNTTDQLTIQGQFSASYLSLFSNNATWMNEIDTFKFEDGTSLTAAQLRQKMLADAKTSGDDKIYGFSSEDVLDGGAGNDYLWGGNEADTYRFGKGYGHDTIDDGMDNILGGRNDKLVFNADVSAGDVRFARNGASEDLTVTLSDGSVLTIAGQFSSTQTGPFGQIWFNRVDSFEFANGKDAALSADQVMDLVLTQGKTSGDDTIYGFARHDVLDGGTGNDFLDGGEDADTYIFGLGYGHDTIQDTHENILYDYFDTLKFGAGITIDDLLITKVIGKSDINIAIKGTTDSVTLRYQTSRDYLNTNFNGVESFEFTNGTKLDKDTLRQMAITGQQTAGNDAIEGTHYGDVIEGGKGNDTITGDGGGDTYIFNKGDGQDVISDFIDNLWFDQADTLKFGTGIATTDIGLARGLGNDLVVTIAGGTDKITIKDHFYGGNTWDFFAIENIEFANGTVWDQAAIKAKVIEQATSSGNDTIVAFDDAETLTGGKGNDSISGGGGNDTYVYARGDGKDTITDDGGETNDRLVFTNINSNKISIARSGSDLTLVVAESTPGAGDGGSVTLKNNAEGWNNTGVDKVVFADGSSWTLAELREHYFAQESTTGNNTINGFEVADTIRGGKGDDQLYGAGGDDSYVYARGDGDDTITDGSLGGDHDSLILSNLNPSDVALVRNGGDVLVIVKESATGAGDGGSILLKYAFEDWFGQGVDGIRFADGTTWTRSDIQVMLLSAAGTPGNDQITGTQGDDILAGGKGNDQINGAGGNDTYVYSRGDGDDALTDGSLGGSNDRLVLAGINPTDVSLVRNGTNLTIVVHESVPGAGDGGSILLQESLDTWFDLGVDSVLFADGTRWTREELRVRLLAQASTAGNDSITGFNDKDVITGGKGNDTVAGGEGDDTFIYTRGDGNDTIQEPGGGLDTLVLKNVAVSTVTLTSTAQDITLKIAETSVGAGNGGTILLTNSNNVGSEAGIDRVVFDDGTIWTEGALKTILTSGGSFAGNDEYSGNSSANMLNGGKGNDVLVGQGGNDTYVYARGDGKDTIIESAGGGTGDKLTFTNINTNKVTISHNEDDVTITIAESTAGAGDGGSILLKGGLDENLGQGIEQIVFADATTWTRATLRQMLIDYAGTTGNDSLTDTGTSHVISGGKGNDTIDGGGGDDIYLYRRGDGVDTLSDYGGYNDRLILVDINPASVSLTRDTYSNSVQLVIAESTPGAGDGGSILLAGGLVDDYGVAVDKVVFADGTIWTHADFRAKLLAQSQTSGNDTIYGFGYEEVITGGKGNDTIYGFGSSDTYVYSRGDGHDVIYEGTNEGGADRLVFTNINPSAVTLVRNGNDVKLVIAESAPGAGDAGSILLSGAVEDYYWQGVDQVVFADGTVWQHANLRAMLQAQSQTAGNDTINGFGGDDILVGGTGDDVMDGQGGNDTYKYTRGDGNDTITDGTNSGTADKLILTGVNAADITIQRDNADVRLIIAPSTPGATDGGSITLGSQNGYYWSGVDQIIFGNGETWTTEQLLGKTATFRDLNGDGYVYGSAGNDRLDAGPAGKYLQGRDGSDTYVYGAGYGEQNIWEYSINPADIDTVELINLNASDVTLSRDWTWLDIYINATGERLRIQEEFASPVYGVDQIKFADGTIWDRTKLAASYIYQGSAGSDSLNPGSTAADTISGLAGDDALYGAAGDDTLIGGTGNDYLRGDLGNDIYLYSKGDGNDQIEDASTSLTDIDVLRLKDLNAADVTLSRIGNDLRVGVNQNGAVITVTNQFYNWTDEHRGIEEIQFADGAVWSLATIVQNTAFRGTAAGEYLPSNSVDADTIIGGLGNDTLSGAAGSDVYVYAHGDGDDTIVDGSPSTADIDVLRLIDLNASQITLSRNVNALFVVDNTNGAKITVQDQYYSTTQNWGIEKIEFADGTAWNLAQILANAPFRGTSGNDTLLTNSVGADTIVGGLGNDYMCGASGSDIYVYAHGDGDDAIDDESGSTTEIDVLRLVGFTSSEIAITRDTRDLFITDSATGSVITVQYQFYSTTANWGIERIEFGDGAAWDLTQILANIATAGTAGDDTMSGTAGVDHLAGGKGNDTYIVNHAGDVVIEQVAGGIDNVQSSVTHTLAANIESLVLTGTSAINGTGNAGANTLTGNVAANVLDGGAGADSLIGGAGNDTYIVDNIGDAITEATGGGTDAVQSSVSYTLAANVETLTLTGDAFIDGTGNGLANTITGNTGDNKLDGGAGNDTLNGGGGNDTYYVDSTTDVINEAVGAGTDSVFSAATYTLAANVENLTLTGSGAINGTGNTLANVLTGNSGANKLTGGDGDDTYVVQNTTDTVVEAAGKGNDTVLSSVTFTLSADVENLTLTGTAAINGTGNTLANVLTGNSADNTLSGGTGADKLAGKAGNDTYVVDDIGDIVNEDANEGTDTVQSAINYALTANVEKLTLTGSAAINGTGNSLDNVLTGNTGINTLAGGEGNDTYVVQNTTDVVSEVLGQGTDTVQSSVTYTLGANVENLTLTGSTAIDGNGNGLDNVLTGNSALNTLAGGAGNDTYVVQTTTDVVTEQVGEGTDTVQSVATYTLGANVENLTLTGSTAINGTGNELANVLTGNTGTNALTGGAGNDTYVVQNTTDTVSEAVGGGVDTVQSSVTFALAAEVENLTLTGTAAINGTGNELANVLIGNSAANTLTGGLGADNLAGGVGNDIYVVDDIGDTVVENADEGNDLVQSSVTYTLAANVERLTLTGSAAINATGNSLDNVLTGNTGINALTGGDGNDTYVVQNTTDTVIEASNQGIDTVQSGVTFTLSANVENLTLTGSTAANGTGNALDNILIGNSATNTLKGMDGNDTYIIQNTADVVTENASQGVDTVQSSVSFTLGANVENLTLTGSAALNGTGNGLANVMIGNSGANTLTGLAGNDQLRGGVGNDSLNGGDGADTYEFGRGDNVDTILNSDADGGLDKLRFLSDIDADQLWFKQAGNDLNISIIGTDDLVTVQGWYSSAVNKLDRIEIADGRYLGVSDVETLRSAMVAFNPPPIGQTALDTNVALALAPTLAASWHAA
jgi:Ca2+-binding RTX toxin-like protein